MYDWYTTYLITNLSNYQSILSFDQVYRNLTELLNIDDVKMLYLEFVVTEDKLGKLDDDDDEEDMDGIVY